MPLVVLALLMVISAAVSWHGRTVAQQAAMSGAERAVLVGADLEQGRQAAQMLAQTGGLRDVQVSITQAGNLIQVRVNGRVATPFGAFSQVSAGSVRPMQG